MQPTLESKFTLFQTHPTLTPMCLKNPTKMNFLLEQSLKHIAFFSRNLPTPLGLPESMNDDSPSQSILLDDVLESLCESFSRECYSWSKGLRPILTVIFFVIISKDLRGVICWRPTLLIIERKTFLKAIKVIVPMANPIHFPRNKNQIFRERSIEVLTAKEPSSHREIFPRSICHNGKNRRSNHR